MYLIPRLRFIKPPRTILRHGMNGIYRPTLVAIRDTRAGRIPATADVPMVRPRVLPHRSRGSEMVGAILERLDSGGQGADEAGIALPVVGNPRPDSDDGACRATAGDRLGTRLPRRSIHAGA